MWSEGTCRVLWFELCGGGGRSIAVVKGFIYWQYIMCKSNKEETKVYK